MNTPTQPFSADAPDPFAAPSRPARHGSSWWLWVITLGLLGTVVWLQRPEPSDPTDAKLAATGMDKVAPPHLDQLVIMGKLLIAVRGLSPISTPQVQQFIDQAAGWESSGPMAGPPSLTNPPKERAEPMSAADRLRATVLAGEHLGPAELDWRLRDIERTLDPVSPLRADVTLMRTLYSVPAQADGQAKSDDAAAPTAGTKPAALTPEILASIEPNKKQEFVDRHGWFADLALTRNDPRAPVRERAAGDGTLMVALLVIVGVAVVVAGLAGLALLIVAAVMLFGGTLRPALARPRPETEWPMPAGARASSVWLETVAVFLGGFLALKLVGAAAAAAFPDASWTVWVSLLGQWTLISAIFWPVARGMPVRRWREEIGWHAGRGVAREIGCGIMGYLACLPVYFGMAIVVVILSMIISALTGSDPIKPGDNKLLDVVGGGGALALICIYLLATIWAPVVEESIFRGAMFRHLRRRTGLVLAALGSCLMFAILHGYVIAGLFMVGTLGFWFALMREWRGSLIAPATAHFIHNGVVLAVLIALVKLGSV